jgi:hypothetical protein
VKVYRVHYSYTAVIVAEDELACERYDCSDESADSKIDSIVEVDAACLKRMHPSWLEYVPGGTNEDHKTLAELLSPAPLLDLTKGDST